MNTHTPLPWRPCDVPGAIRGANGELVAMCMNDGPLDLTVPDSQLIVRAVNTHAELVAAIEMVLDASEDCGDMDDIDWDQLRAALAKVEGGK